MTRPGDRQYRSGLDAHRSGSLDAACRHYVAALARNPEHRGALHHLGVLALANGDHLAAIRLIERSLAKGRRGPAALSNLGLSLIAAGQYEEAARALRQAIERRPAFVDARYNLAVALEAADDPAAALAGYQAVLALAPDHADAHCNYAVLSHREGDRSLAVPHYRRALELAPALRRLHVYLSVALCELGEHQAAVAAGADAIRATPEDPSAWVALADARYYGGDLAGSLDPLREALRRLHAAGACAAPWAVEHVPWYRETDFAGALHAAVACFERVGIQAFLTGGTLLGAMRERGFISFDKDIDFGVFDDVAEAEIRAAFESDPEMSFSRTNGPEPVIVTYYWRNAVAIDVFRFFRERGRTWCGLYCDEHVMQWSHRPFGLVEHDWNRLRVLIPEDAGYFLAEDYGEWRVPNPYFHMASAPCMEGGMTPICRSLVYTALFRALVRRQRAQAVSLCEQVLAIDPGDDGVAGLLQSLFASADETAANPSEPALAGLGRRRNEG